MTTSYSQDARTGGEIVDMRSGRSQSMSGSDDRALSAGSHVTDSRMTWVKPARWVVKLATWTGGR